MPPTFIICIIIFLYDSVVAESYYAVEIEAGNVGCKTNSGNSTPKKVAPSNEVVI